MIEQNAFDGVAGAVGVACAEVSVRRPRKASQRIADRWTIATVVHGSTLDVKADQSEQNGS